MKLRSLARFLQILTVACCTLTEATARADQPGIVSADFTYESAPYLNCHASTIAETPQGLVAAWFGGTYESHPDVGIWVVRQVNGRWGEQVEVANGVQSDGSRHPCWNPVLFQPKVGPLLLFYKVGPNPRTWWGMLKTSDDGGKTWSEARRLPDGILGPIKNKPVQLANGDLLCPSSTESDEPDRRRSKWRVQFERTSDLGKTWTKISPPAGDSDEEINAIQPSILFHGGDKLQAVGRTRGGKLFETWSEDGGKTWSRLAYTQLPNPSAGTDAVTLRDGRHLLIYNHTAKGRSPLNLAVSKDGKAWNATLMLEDTPLKEFSYPAIIQTADGLVHVVYTWHRKHIKHVVVDPAKLQGTPIEGGQWPASVALLPDNYEVVVIGATPGGIATAVTAARLGRRVLLIEYHRHVGAMSTSGLGASDIEHRAVIQGIFREFVDRVKAYYVGKYGADSEDVKLCRDGYWYEPSVAEQIFEGFLKEQMSLTVLKNQQLEKVETQGGRVVAAVFKDRASGMLRTITGKIFADGTYEGDVYALAGAAFRLGRESRDEFQEPHAGHIYANARSQTIGGTGAGDKRLPAYTFRLCLTSDKDNQVPLTAPPPDYDRTRYLGYLDDLKSGRFGAGRNLTTIAFTLRQLPNHKIDVNMKPTPLGFVFAEENAGYVEEDTAAREAHVMRLRNLTLGLLWFLQHDEQVPADAHELALKYQPCRDEFSDNGNFPFQLYIREARRLIGEYTLSEKNITEQPGVVSERLHPDSIAVGEFPIDSFPMQKRQPGDEVVLEGYLGMFREITRPYQIPYRIMIPQKLDGLIVPVAASTTHVAFSSIRLEPTWMALGQAAGTAAHLALKHDVQPRAVPVAELQQLLREQRAVLEIPADETKNAAGK